MEFTPVFSVADCAQADVAKSTAAVVKANFFMTFSPVVLTQLDGCHIVPPALARAPDAVSGIPASG
jgi:hypothetical protein